MKCHALTGNRARISANIACEKSTPVTAKPDSIRCAAIGWPTPQPRSNTCAPGGSVALNRSIQTRACRPFGRAISNRAPCRSYTPCVAPANFANCSLCMKFPQSLPFAARNWRPTPESPRSWRVSVGTHCKNFFAWSKFGRIIISVQLQYFRFLSCPTHADTSLLTIGKADHNSITGLVSRKQFCDAPHTATDFPHCWGSSQENKS
jgi:hypothetical protein